MTKTIPNKPTMNEGLANQIALYGKTSVGQDLELIKTIDLFKSSGFKNTDLISPKSAGSTSTEELFEWCKQQIINGLPNGVRALLEMSAKAAGDKQIKGQNRSYWKRQPNSIIGGLQTQLKNREEIDAEIASGKQGADARTRSSETIAKDQLGKIITRLQKAETFKSKMDLDTMISQLQAMVKAIG